MKPYLYAALVIAGSCTVAACGGSTPQEKAAADIQKSAEEMQKGSDSLSKGAEDMAKGFEAMARGFAGAAGAGNGDVKPVDPVSFRELQTVMPDVSGWEKGKPTGERMTSPFSFSQASVTYTRGDAEIEQKIMDSGFNQLLFTPFTMFMAAGYEKETQDGFERSVNIAGNPGWEKWDKESKNGELNVVVGKRFLVQLEGRGLDDIKTLHTVFEQTDVAKLASLK
ncbi:MAG TPA: hypothetical protein VM032_10480 [Vicinamibacterales bacterium]|nr:hypothetical protein [Vicinamibacterales bacterium]